MLGFGDKKHSDKVIRSAHEKQKRKIQGQGGVIFTPEERAVLDNHVTLDKAEDK